VHGGAAGDEFYIPLAGDFGWLAVGRPVTPRRAFYLFICKNAKNYGLTGSELMPALRLQHTSVQVPESQLARCEAFYREGQFDKAIKDIEKGRYEVARLTLDRPEHNLLNERMLAEVAAGINSLGERAEIKLIVMDSAGKAFSGGIELGEYTQRRVFQLLDAFHNAFSAMLDTSKPVLVVMQASPALSVVG